MTEGKRGAKDGNTEGDGSGGGGGVGDDGKSGRAKKKATEAEAEEYVELSVPLDEAMSAQLARSTRSSSSRPGRRASARARPGSSSTHATPPLRSSLQTLPGSNKKAPSGMGDSLSLWLRLAAPLLLAAARSFLARRRANRSAAGNSGGDGGNGEDSLTFPELDAIREMGRSMRAEAGRSKPRTTRLEPGWFRVRV
jgi:hypothetical protein